MPIEDIIHVTIQRGSPAVSKASFAKIAIAGFHAHWGATEYFRSYRSSTALSTLVSEGFSTSDPIYLAASAIVSQNPRPDTFLVLKLSTTWTQVVRITPTASDTNVFSGTVNGQAWTVTPDPGDVLADNCTDIASAITALTGVTASGASGTHVDVTFDTAAKLFNVAKGTSAGVYKFEDVTAATNLESELAAIRLINDTWYGLVIDCQSSARIAAAAHYAEGIQALFVANTADSECLESSTGDIMHTLKTSNYARTASIYHPDYDSFAGAAWLGAVLPYDAGGATWAFKTLAGVSTPVLTSTQQDNIATKRGNFYVEVAGISGTRWGVTASAEYIDTTLCIDWLHSRWSERLFSLLSSVPKLPYTDQSVTRVKSELGAVNGIAVRRGILADDPAPTVTAPKVADVDPDDRAGRLLPDVEVAGRLAGAIHEIDVTASLSV